MKKFVYLLSLVCLIQACEDSDNSQVYEEPRTALMNYYENRMKEKNFQFIKNGSCDDAFEDTIHERYTVYFDSKQISEMKITTEFKFISSCCQEFYGDYTIKNDTLKFLYEQVNNEACGCLCMYKYKLIINEPRKKYSIFRIEKKVSSSFSDSLRGNL